MNVWGLFVLLFGLLMVIIAVRNSLANLAPLVPGAGGTIGGGVGGLQASGSGGGTSANTPGGTPNVLPANTGLFTAPRAGLTA